MHSRAFVDFTVHRYFVYCRQSDRAKEHDDGFKVVFRDICVTLGKTEILKNVSGFASVDQMLGILGSSGNDVGLSVYAPPYLLIPKFTIFSQCPHISFWTIR